MTSLEFPFEGTPEPRCSRNAPFIRDSTIGCIAFLAHGDPLLVELRTAHLEHAGWLPEHVCVAVALARGVEPASVRTTFRRHVASRAIDVYREWSLPPQLRQRLKAADDYRVFYAEYLAHAAVPFESVVQYLTAHYVTDPWIRKLVGNTCARVRCAYGEAADAERLRARILSSGLLRR
jgi:hypothetical protein